MVTIRTTCHNIHSWPLLPVQCSYVFHITPQWTIPSLNNINSLVIVMEMQCVVCEAWILLLNIILKNFMLPGIQGLSALLILFQWHWQWYLPQHQLHNWAYKSTQFCQEDKWYQQWTASLLPSGHQAHTGKTFRGMTDQKVPPAHDMPDILLQSASTTPSEVTICRTPDFKTAARRREFLLWKCLFPF